MMNVKSMTNRICALFESFDEKSIYEQTELKFRIELRDLLVLELVNEGVTNPDKVARMIAATCKVDLTDGFHREYPAEFNRLVKTSAHGFAMVTKIMIAEFGEENIAASVGEFSVHLVYE